LNPTSQNPSALQFLDFTLVNIRLKQIERESGGLGTIYLLLLSGSLLLAGYSLYQAYLELNYALGILGVISMILISLHRTRRDSCFVWHRLNAPAQSLFSEYWLFSLPFVLPAAFTWQFWIIIVHFLLCLGLSRWYHKPKEAGIYWPQLSKLVPPSYFEWLSGLRRNWLPFLLIYLFVWIFCWVRALPIVGLWGLTFIITTFYNEGEPRNLLQVHLGDSPAVFLRRKIMRQALPMLILFIPPLAVNALFHPDIWPFHLLFLLMYLLVLMFMITSKYSVYEPAKELQGTSVWQSLGLLGAVIPFLAPLPLFLTLRNYIKAVRHLKKFLG